MIDRNQIKLICLVLCFTMVKTVNAQIPFDGKSAIMGGIAFRSGTQTGLYFQTKSQLQNQGANYDFDFAPKDGGTGKSMDFRAMNFGEKTFQEANADGILYLMLSIVGVKRCNPEADDFFGNGFTNKKLNEKYYTIPNISKHSHMVSNYKLVEYTGNKAYDNGFMWGGRIDWRTVGITSSGFTYFSYSDYKYQNSSSLISKFCFGVDVGYRKNIGKFTSVTILAFDRNMRNGKTISVTANPSVKTTLFFGKNMGFYSTLKYEYQKGIAGILFEKVPYTLSVFEFKIGAYITSNKDF